MGPCFALAGLTLSRQRPASAVATATTVRVQDGKSLTTDRPFADNKEVFGGHYLFDVLNLDEALELAAQIPAARPDGSVAVRPVVER